MGRIIRNRSGSLGKTDLEMVFEEGMKIHLRMLSEFFEIISNERDQQDIIEIISSRLEHIIENKSKRPSEEKLEKMSRIIFWNLNFVVVYSFIDKIIHSLGSDKLIDVATKVCDTENTPASSLVKHGILMWYKKNLQIDAIGEKITEESFSGTAKRVMDFLIVNHCRMHSIRHKDIKRIENKFGISSKKLLLERAKTIMQE